MLLSAKKYLKIWKIFIRIINFFEKIINVKVVVYYIISAKYNILIYTKNI